MSEYKDSLLVLRTYKLGEADRILSCISKQHGKVRVVAKGARKSKSKFGGRVEPFTEVFASIWKGRGELDTLRQAEVVSLNAELHEELDKLIKASTVVEIVDKVSFDGQDLSALYELATRALRTLSVQDSPNFLSVFALRVLSLEGLAPQLDGCGLCGSPNVVALDYLHSYGLCRKHVTAPIPSEVVEMMRAVLVGRTGAVLAMKDTVLSREFETVVMRYFEQSLSMKLASLSLHRGGSEIF
ncbi:DNA replication and repair protein RecO [Ferrithrix thermotolerans DSM 19514]|uniref:DNA repair protein RecO n=1 Tax=Ferrithrix thermotolerans DSM 19514 TaxID=1121881 RepID=A0A1M4USE7_9ACTN|nr:DNA repair protein RecO [Ferrithrix thermotolerans]SHE59662.1 DNA replication and repair protein RecO [Ferrithrix thermotolerans DSM 19514]